MWHTLVMLLECRGCDKELGLVAFIILRCFACVLFSRCLQQGSKFSKWQNNYYYFLEQAIYSFINNSHRSIDERVLGHVHIQGKRFKCVRKVNSWTTSMFWSLLRTISLQSFKIIHGLCSTHLSPLLYNITRNKPYAHPLNYVLLSLLWILWHTVNAPFLSPYLHVYYE